MKIKDAKDNTFKNAEKNHIPKLSVVLKAKNHVCCKQLIKTHPDLSWPLFWTTSEKIFLKPPPLLLTFAVAIFKRIRNEGAECLERQKSIQITCAVFLAIACLELRSIISKMFYYYYC